MIAPVVHQAKAVPGGAFNQNGPIQKPRGTGFGQPPGPGRPNSGYRK